MRRIRNIFIVVACVAALVVMVNAKRAETLMVQKIFNAVTVVASGTGTYPTTGIDLTKIPDLQGFFSLYVEVSGDGTANIEYLLSHDNVTYHEPSSGANIATSVVKTSGPGSDGKETYSFEPELARYLKVKVTETGGANTVTVSAWIAIH